MVKHAETALHPGGIFVSYLPTIGQVAQLHEALEASAFGMAQTIEVLQRSWHVAGQSVRPDHRMVAHTGFLTSARLLVPDSSLPTPRARLPAAEDSSPAPESDVGRPAPEDDLPDSDSGRPASDIGGPESGDGRPALDS